jgi:hypothetical protein
MSDAITCRWCGQPIGMNLYEVFDHVNCTRLAPAAGLPSSAEDVNLAWRVEKLLNRVNRRLERLQRQYPGGIR